MTIYDDEIFKMACDQFQVIADYLNIDPNDREWATYPKRAVAVTLPVHMDDGSTKAFQGYRVQHHIALGPTKGGTRFAPSLSMGETAALEMRTGQPALWRRQGWRRCRSDEIITHRARSRLAPLHAGNDSVRGSTH